MKDKIVYVVEAGSLNSVNKTFEFNDMEVFTSKKKALEYITYNYENTYGYDLEIENIKIWSSQVSLHTYKTKTHIETEILLRYKLSIKKLK